MRKIVKKIVMGTLLFIITFISGIITLILYPQPLFAGKLVHKNFRVYSNNALSTDIEIILDSANTIVSKSELYDSSYRYDIFFAYHSLYNTIDDKLLGRGPSAKSIDNNLVIKIDVDPKRNVAFTTFHDVCKTDLTYLIAHEMVHCLQANKYGKIKFNPFRHPEMWKLEGYPEYVSKQLNSYNDYDFINDIDRYIDMRSKSKDGWISIGNNKCSVPEIYYKSGLMMKYLIDIKNFSYDKIFSDTVSGDKVYVEMIKWKDRVKRSNK